MERYFGLARATFRARAGAAPLKQLGGFTVFDVMAGIPRPRGRGPVEAPVIQVKKAIISVAFRARAGAAPLKLQSGNQSVRLK